MRKLRAKMQEVIYFMCAVFNSVNVNKLFLFNGSLNLLHILKILKPYINPFRFFI